ncbi:MAG: NAD(P)-dependent oxidoreductase [Dehalococcoidia bacterium]|nr:NAD(P)-dependent oxidoreductase [Dehalococcoidia bacterium]
MPPAITNEKILVTGVTGRFARPIALALAPHNQVWGLARFTDPASRLSLESAGVRCIPLDLADPSLDPLPRDFSYVLHAGGLVPPDTERDHRHTLDINAHATGRLMAHCRPTKGFLYCSTGGVSRYQGHLALKEDDPLGLHIPGYHLSKIAAESVIAFASTQWRIPAVILRIGTHYSNGGGAPAVRIQRMLDGKPVWAHPDRPNIFSLIHEDDATPLTIKALTIGQTPPLILNLGGEPASVEDYCAYAGELLGVTPQFHYTADAYPGIWLDTTRMERLLGPAHTPWRDGIRRMVTARYSDRLRRP